MKNLFVCLICFCFLCVSGCTEKASKCELLIVEAKKSLDLYSVDSSKLNFELLVPCFADKDFLRKAGEKDNIQAVSRVMIIMQSYDSLEEILKQADWLNEYSKRTLSYYVNFRRYEQIDTVIAESFVLQALEYIDENTNKSASDTSKLVDFYCFLSLQIGKDETLLRIDSIFGKQSHTKNLIPILSDAVVEFY